MSGNTNFNMPEIQEIINDPKIKPILQRLQQEGKLDINEIHSDRYVASRFKILIDKKILNIQKMDKIIKYIYLYNYTFDYSIYFIKYYFTNSLFLYTFFIDFANWRLGLDQIPNIIKIYY